MGFAAAAFIVVSLLAGAQSRAYVPPQPSATVDLTQAGQASKGLTLSLSVSKSTFHAGDPISVTATIKNSGPEVWIQRSLVDTDFTFQFLKKDNEVLPIKQLSNLPSVGKATTGAQLSTGGNWEVTFDLGELYDLTRPGVYKVVASSPIFLKDQTAVYTRLTSNPISFRITL